MELPPIFLELSSLYKEKGFSLYMVGGTSRDYLLGLPVLDYDFVTDATPDEEKTFLPNASYAFARFGSVQLKKKEGHIDITTFREEGDYDDHRHPKTIHFIKDMKLDSCRRDFTINAIYIDADGKIYDFHQGQADLNAGLIRFIGEPRLRIHEDPLRILRAERFARRLGFRIEEESQKAMDELRDELAYLSPDKVLMESKKG